MDYTWILPAAGAVVVIGAAIAAIVKVGAWVFRTIRLINGFLEDWNGEVARHGRSAVPGVMERLVELETHARAIVHEVQPNSGLSLRDSVNRIEEHTVPSKETQ